MNVGRQQTTAPASRAISAGTIRIQTTEDSVYQHQVPEREY
jgi:hypothetical protein